MQIKLQGCGRHLGRHMQWCPSYAPQTKTRETLAASFETSSRPTRACPLNNEYFGKRVTPYMHIAAYHVQGMMQRHGGIKQFSGQGLEKNNSDSKGFWTSSNRHDPTGVMLMTKQGQHALQHTTTSTRLPVVRQKRRYSAQDQ